MASFWLEFEQNGSIQQFPFDSHSIAIGRDKSSDFVLDHPTVSRQHARIITEGPGRFRLQVLSRGGLTAIDGSPVQTDVELYDGATLQLGKLSFRFRSEYAPRAQHTHSSGMAAMSDGYGAAQARPGFGSGPIASSFGQPATPSPGQFGPTPGHGGGHAPGPGFGQTPSPGFGQAPAHGFGQTGTGGFGQTPAPGFGQTPASGAFGQVPTSGQTPDSAKPNGGGEGGIMSWDEIAQSSDDESEHEVQATDFEKIRNAGKKDEQTNPALVGGALILIVGLLLYTFIDTGGDAAGEQNTELRLEDLPPVEIVVDCSPAADCLRQARVSYRVGIDLIDKKDVENRNLFDGYKRLLETRAFLEKATSPPPADMDRLDSAEQAARNELDQKFRNFQLQFHQNSQRQDYQSMVSVLEGVQNYFPDRTAREHRWAIQKELEMKQDGTYPARQRM